MPGTCKAIGDIDGVSGQAFSAALRDTIDSSDEMLVSVDCSGVTFMDPAGYHALVDATRYAARHGHTLVIRNMPPSCTRLIRQYAWDRELRVEPSPTRAEMIRDALFFSGDSRRYPRQRQIELPYSSSHLVGGR
jgi:anti-anti-sigma factor